MAHVDSKGMVRGTAGSVVYRAYRNKNIIQGKPGKFKQTTESIKASTEFGLSSSAAAVIRRAFEPAYIHRDGEAASRSTQQVYQSLRNSLTGMRGQRDLHDANLQDLLGMNFNAGSNLNEVLHISHTVSKDEEGNMQVRLTSFNPSQDIRKAAGIPLRASLYRIRLTLIAFDFRQEYLEYLDIQDVDVHTGNRMNEQVIKLKGTEEPGCMMLLSLSLLMYNQMERTGEYVLLNNKNFSPCAIIGTFQSTEPSARTADPINISIEAYPIRYLKMQEMGYAGNQLLRGFQKRLKNKQDQQSKHLKPPQNKEPLPVIIGKKHFFGAR